MFCSCVSENNSTVQVNIEYYKNAAVSMKITRLALAVTEIVQDSSKHFIF